MKRTRQRGAAMVEACIVFFLLVIVWGAMATAYAHGNAKLAAQWTARVSVMYHASHDCRRSLPGGGGSTTEPSGRFDTRTGDGDGDRALAGIADGTVQAKSSFFVASAFATKTRSLANREATKSSNSWCICNEGKHEGAFALLKYGADLFRDFLPGPIQALLP